MHAGTFINSTFLLDGSFFEKTIILITEYNENGAIGFVINKPFPRKFNELEEFKDNIAFPLFDGGPVDREHLFFLHRRPDLISDGVLVTDNIYLGGDFKTAVEHIKNKTITEKEIKLFIGYCGWDARDLDNELEEGSWLPSTNGIVF